MLSNKINDKINLKNKTSRVPTYLHYLKKIFIYVIYKLQIQDSIIDL